MKHAYQTLETFFQTPEALCHEATRLKLKLSLSDATHLLLEPVLVGGRLAPNRLCTQPMEGCDATLSGAPDTLTVRRYGRFAEGGFGLIWVEATAVHQQGRSNARQLWINRQNVAAFSELVSHMRACARKRWGHDILIVLQLAPHAGRFSLENGVSAPLCGCDEQTCDSSQEMIPKHTLVSDEDLDRLQDATLAAALLAKEAGFDGVDIKACHNDLLAELLYATTRVGRYGGGVENRTRFICEVVEKLRVAQSDLILASRISLRAGSENRAAAVEMATCLASSGVQLLNIAPADESGKGRHKQRHALQRYARLAEVTQAVQQALPDLPVVAGGLSWFRHFLPQVAAGVLQQQGGTFIGVGRAALAYPELAGVLLQNKELDADACCLVCDACVQLIRDGGCAGCVVMDQGIYGEEYRRRHYFSMDNLREEAKRCRGCYPAPCRTACPTRIDVPAFLKAFANNDLVLAYDLIRHANVLPGMCASLCPVGSLCEGHCVAATLDGTPIPIHAIQYAVYWNALQSGLTGVCVPQVATEKKVAIIGGGPAGLSCAVTLLACGHQVVLFEREARLGGTPELAIRESRFKGAHDEALAVLKPALRSARLVIRYGVALGREITLEHLRHTHDAVFLAMGVWGERTLGSAEGVVPGVTFLRQVKSQKRRSVPERVILLAGGDSAMDCARVALELGARELLIVYAGALSEMHWHMRDSWFRTEGVHVMTMTRPIDYSVAANGKVSGVRIKRNLVITPEGTPIPEEMLAADLIIEAMGLGLELALTRALSDCSFTPEGLVRVETEKESLSCGVPGLFAGGGVINGGDSVVQCVAEGMQAGREIHRYLQTVRSN